MFQFYLEFLLPAIYAFCIMILSFFLSAKIFQKYLERQNKPLLHLSLTYFFYATTVFATDLGYFYQLFFGIPTQWDFFSRLWLRWSVTLSMICIGNYFLFCFAQELYALESRPPRIILGLATLTVVGIFFTVGGVVNSRDWKYVLVLVLALPVYFYVMLKSYQAWKATTDPVFVRRFKSIFLSVVFLPLIFVFFLVDLVLGPYGIGFYLAWLSALLSQVVAYFGYVPPTQKDSPEASQDQETVPSTSR